MSKIKNGDVVEFQGSCWVITGKSGASYHLASTGGTSANIHVVPRIAFTVACSLR